MVNYESVQLSERLRVPRSHEAYEDSWTVKLKEITITKDELHDVRIPKTKNMGQKIRQVRWGKELGIWSNPPVRKSKAATNHC